MLFIFLLSRLPLSVLYLLSDVLFFIVYHVVRYRKSMVRKNLKNTFPTKSDKEIASIGKEFFRRLCDYGVETIKLLTISEKEFKKRAVMKDSDISIANHYAANNQPFFYFASHQFNWEWLLGTISLTSPIDAYFIYQPQHNRFVDRLLLKIRTRFQASAIMRQHVSKETIRLRNKACSISVVADQFPGYANDKVCWINFLNQETAFFRSLGRLTCMLNYPVVFIYMQRIRRGYYICRFVKLAEPPYDQISDTTIMERYAAIIEKMIMKDIPGWLWSHNRWKQVRKHSKKDSAHQA